MGGFKYKMRLVYSHFPINAQIAKDGNSITIKNFLGGKQDKHIPMLGGTKVRLTPATEGNDNAALSQCCARVSQVCKTGRKDVRKFLDGIYVSQKTLVQPRET